MTEFMASDLPKRCVNVALLGYVPRTAQSRSIGEIGANKRLTARGKFRFKMVPTAQVGAYLGPRT
jgi:hypothetical protein